MKKIHIMIVMIFAFMFSMKTFAAWNPHTFFKQLSKNSFDYYTATASDMSISLTATDSNIVDSCREENMIKISKDKMIVSEESLIDIEIENCLFNFIIDPYRLVEKTNAIKYGGGTVEKGATLLFHNKERAYDFSSESDWVTISIQEPSEIMVSAHLDESDELIIAEDRDFKEGDISDIYLALIDDQGNEQALTTEEEVSISLFLESGSYSFGLTGACNADADWAEKSSIHPKVTLIWSLEAASIEDEDALFFDEDDENELENKQESIELTPEINESNKAEASEQEIAPSETEDIPETDNSEIIESETSKEDDSPLELEENTSDVEENDSEDIELSKDSELNEDNTLEEIEQNKVDEESEENKESEASDIEASELE